jgi:glutamine amidotransferase
VCELLGVSVSPAARLGVYFTQLRPRAEHNREGWGIAWWESGRPRIVKEPGRIDESATAARLAQHPPTSEIFIVHIRAATIGSATRENAHPFVATALERDWVFAHNGTVQQLERLTTGDFEPEGETDSERAFHHILTRLGALGAGATDDAVAAEVLATGRELSERESKVNFVLSDGRSLFAYHDGHKTLHVLGRRGADLGEIGMADEDYSLSLTVGDAPDERALIVASVPLTDEPGWQKLGAGEFLVARDGLLVERVASGASWSTTGA